MIQPSNRLNVVEKNGKTVFTVDVGWIWRAMHPDDREQKYTRMIVQEEGISFVHFSAEGLIGSDTAEIFYYEGDSLGFVDSEGIKRHLLTSNWVTDIEWITENKKTIAFVRKVGESYEKERTVIILDKYDSTLRVLKELKPCSDTALCLSDDEVFCMQENAIVVADFLGNIKKTIDLNELQGWVVSGPPYKGHKHHYIPLMKAGMKSEKYEERTVQHIINIAHNVFDSQCLSGVTPHTTYVAHARLELDTGHIDKFSSNQTLDPIPTF